MSARILAICAHRLGVALLLSVLLLVFAASPDVTHAAARAKRARYPLPVQAALLVNLSTGQTLYEQRADSLIPPASLTKVMTMFLAYDAIRAKRLKENRLVTVPAHAAHTGGSTMHLRAGERVGLTQLLTGMAVASGNDAATTVAHVVNPNMKTFVRAMNQKARELGMRATTFVNPTGLPAKGQLTTARDMAKLATAYMKRHPQARRIHATRHFLHNGTSFGNTNPLLGVVQGVDGLKTGFTAASGYNVIITATRGKTRLLIVILGGKTSAQRNDAARRLLEAGFKYPTSRKQLRQNM